MPTLGYWKIRGLAQPIRLLLTYAGEDFENVMYEQGDAPDYSRESWMSVKQSMGLDFPNLPYYMDGDVKITQSNAILKHIARKHKLDGATEKEKAVVDMMLDQAMDLRNGIVRLCYNKDYESLKGDYFKNIPTTLALFEKKLENSLWFAGDKITVCDFAMYELLDELRLMKEDILNKYPKLLAFLDRFEALPSIQKYMTSDQFMRRPITVCDFPIYELLDQLRLMKEDSLNNYPKLLAFLSRFEALPSLQKYMASDQFLRRPVNSKIAAFK